jgi:hypothetical protein
MKEFKAKQAKFKSLLRVDDRQGHSMSPSLLNMGIYMKQTTKEWKNTAKIKSN